MKQRPRTAWRPDLVSSISASMFRRRLLTTPAARRVEQQLDAVGSEQRVGPHLNADMSYA